jgi:hypothetical protein
MKPIEDVVCCVVDYGTFICVAEKLAETMRTVYYYSPFSQEYQDVRDCIQGAGLDRVERLDYIFKPDIYDTIDLWVFPDIGYGDLQQFLRRDGKAVFGHFGFNEVEVYRTLFLDTLEEVGLPLTHNEVITGLGALNDYLQDPDHENKWIKVNRFRNQMDTWHHKTYEESKRTLDSLAVIFGGAKDKIVFIVQDDIKAEGEIGYDGWCIDGNYPVRSFQGYEKKNELYLGSCLEYTDLPAEVRLVNERMAPKLAEYGYRNWWSTEIRVAGGVPYFIDATPRMAGQTGEHQLETCRNFADVIWQGANGIVIEPDFQWKVAAEATLHYQSNTKDPTITDEWKMLRIPDEVLPWVKLYHYCKIDGAYHFPGRNTDEVGVAIGVGDTVEQALRHLGLVLDALKNQPVSADVSGFASLFKSINAAEKRGMSFGVPMPKPEIIYRYKGLGG